MACSWLPRGQPLAAHVTTESRRVLVVTHGADQIQIKGVSPDLWSDVAYTLAQELVPDRRRGHELYCAE